MDSLVGLRDIHLPEHGVSAFPPAYGWWVLPALMVAIYLFYKAAKKIWRASAKLYARRILLSLKDDEELAAAVKMSEILRRACVRKYPEAVALSGDEWLNFLNEKSTHKLQEKAAELLKDAPFIAPTSKFYEPKDMRDLWQFCYDWVGDNL